jgi:conjugative transfer signal peptidase TraF
MSGRAALLGLVAAASIAGLPTRQPTAPRLLWNTTASAPLGLWTLRPVRQPRVDDWLAVRPPAALAASLAARGLLPQGVLLLKRVGAVSPSQVCRRGDGVWIDGRLRARALAADRWGRALSQWRGCGALRRGELFLLNPAPGSFDSRYFGPLTTADVVARARPWLVSPGE